MGGGGEGVSYVVLKIKRIKWYSSTFILEKKFNSLMFWMKFTFLTFTSGILFLDLSLSRWLNFGFGFELHV